MKINKIKGQNICLHLLKQNKGQSPSLMESPKSEVHVSLVVSKKSPELYFSGDF